MVHLSLHFWPLYLTRTIDLQRNIPAPASDVLRLVAHDADTALSISPLVTAVIPDPPTQTQAHLDMGWYTVKERINPGSQRTVSLRVLWGRVTDGANATVFGPLGTRVRCTVRATDAKVEEGDGSQTLYEEKLIIEALFFLLPLMLPGTRKTHEDMLDIVSAKALSRKITRSAGTDHAK